VIVSANGSCFSCDGLATVWNIQYLKLQATNGHCINAQFGGQIRFNNIIFHTCSYYHMLACYGGHLWATGNYYISGNAGWGHIGCDSGGIVSTAGRTITLSNTPSFGAAFVCVYTGGVFYAHAMTFSGTGATGSRYSVNGNGVCFTNNGGANYFPGNSAGSVSLGGQYM
jgi:hypothetical protein